MRTLLASLLVLSSGCIADLVAAGQELAPDSDTYDDTTATGDPPLPTSSSTDPDVQTATGDVGTTTTDAIDTTGEPPANVPPTIILFDGIPDYIGEAGPVQLQLAASVDVSAVQLSLDEKILAEGLTLADFPRTHEFFSAKDNGPARSFEVVVADDEGLTAAASATVAVLLPKSGAEKCIFEDPDRGAVVSLVASIKYTAKAIVAVGSRDAGGGPRMALWLLDPNTCALLGQPRTLANWSADPNLKKLNSVGAAVDIDATGNLVVAGNFIDAGVPQSYVALLNAGGSLLWEHVGPVGDEVTGVTAAAGQFRDRTFVVGARRTSNNPVRTDAAIWIYQTTNNAAFVAPPTLLRAPFTDDELDQDPDNFHSESVRAVVLDPSTGNAMAVGEREFSPDGKDPYLRAFAVRVHPLGGIIGAPWTSPAATLFLNDAARSLAVCGDKFVAGGWTRDEPVDASPQPLIFWLDADGSSSQQRVEAALAPSQLHGIACDREHKIVSAGARTTAPGDAKVFMVAHPQGSRADYETGVEGDDGALASACDPRGFCGWGGYRSKDGKRYAVVRVHHP